LSEKDKILNVLYNAEQEEDEELFEEEAQDEESQEATQR